MHREEGSCRKGGKPLASNRERRARPAVSGRLLGGTTVGCRNLLIRITTMARLDIEDFAGKELVRVYIAGRMSEAERVEDALARHGVNYAVDIEPFLRRGLG